MKKYVVLLMCISQMLVADLKKSEANSLYSSGQSYYDFLIERGLKRNWDIPVTVYYTFDDKAFNCDGAVVPLAALIFGGQCSITFEDIYLFSKLSNDNLVRVVNCLPLAPTRGGVPINRFNPFGAFRDDLYTTLFADELVLIDAKQSEVATVSTLGFHYDFGPDDLCSFEVGLNVPFKSKQHRMDLSFEQGTIIDEVTIAQRTLAMQQFDNSYNSIEDFFLRGILQPKGLQFCAHQQKIGIGDISAFAALEFHTYCDIQFGLNIVIPTAGKGSGKFLWEPTLGNGGAYQFDPFIQCIFFTQVPYLNPFVRVACEMSLKFKTNKVRAPTLVTNPIQQQVENVDNLNFPSPFDMYYVSPFSEYDSTIPLFADKLVCVEEKIGTKVQFGLGNYAIGIFNTDLRLGIFYDFYNKSKDSFQSPCSGDITQCCDGTVTTTGSINTCALEQCSNQQTHTLSASLTYKFKNMFEIGLGGQFVLAGRNFPRNRTVYGNITFVF